MIIGLTGRNGAGKGTVADWFTARGFEFTSLSDAIRRDLRARGLEITRDNLIAGGRRLRQAGGAGILASRSLAHIEAEGGGDWIVDSIRNPAEVHVLRTAPAFALVEVCASAKVRYARVVARGRGGDAESLEEFMRQEQAELHSKEASSQQLLATAELADHQVDNASVLDDLWIQLEVLYPQVAIRSGFDES